MSLLTSENVIQFARKLEGKNLQTKTGKNFSVEVGESTLIFTPQSSGKPRKLTVKSLEKAIERFKYHSSFSPSLYRPGGLLATYYLPLFKQFLEGHSEQGLSSWVDDEQEFERQKQASAELSESARLERIAKARPQPETYYVLKKAYKRNPDVVAQKLHEAGDKCQGCNEDAPFTKKSDKKPYLEVHHKVPLSENGPDTLENTIALCPNCHREEHFG